MFVLESEILYTELNLNGSDGTYKRNIQTTIFIGGTSERDLQYITSITLLFACTHTIWAFYFRMYSYPIKFIGKRQNLSLQED